MIIMLEAFSGIGVVVQRLISRQNPHFQNVTLEQQHKHIRTGSSNCSICRIGNKTAGGHKHGFHISFTWHCSRTHGNTNKDS